MQVLSDEEIKSIYYNEPGDYYDLARAIEAAVLERFEVAGFEPVKPYDETRKGAPLYRLKEPE